MIRQTKTKIKKSGKTGLGMKSPIAMVDRTLGCRYEMKYLLTESKARAVTKFVEQYLHFDSYCRKLPKKCYPIVSLYLDSINLRLCRESLDGHKNRFKLRVRSYTDDLDYPRFFEIKRRANTVIIKSRARVMTADVANLLSGLYIPQQHYLEDEKTLRQFNLYQRSIAAVPITRIRYMRSAYESDCDNRVRVTFDRQLAYNMDVSPDISLNGHGWRKNFVNGVILEIKFTGRYPAWLARMATYFNLQPQSMSKYACTVKNACLSGFHAPKTPMFTSRPNNRDSSR